MKFFLWKLGIFLGAFLVTWLAGYGTLQMLIKVLFFHGLFWFPPLFLATIVIGSVTVIALWIMIGIWNYDFETGEIRFD
jgi:hypothetical protein